MDFGCRHYGAHPLSTKVILLLEAGFSHRDIQDYSTAELLEAMFKWTDQGRPRE